MIFHVSPTCLPSLPYTLCAVGHMFLRLSPTVRPALIGLHAGLLGLGYPGLTFPLLADLLGNDFSLVSHLSLC